jgi:hypothetical protein
MSWFDKQQPSFIATGTFGPRDAQKWTRYIEWSGLTQLTELVSLDGMLCPPVLSKVKDCYWRHIVNEDYMLDYFTDLDLLLAETADIPELNLLCVYRNPTSDPVAPIDTKPFELLGFDLVDTAGGVSAQCNCGGFPDVFSNDELSSYGLIRSRPRALEVQSQL